MKFLHYDNQGKILGFYTSEIHETIPVPHLEITDTKWQEYISNQDHLKVDTQLKKVVEIAITLQEYKGIAESEIRGLIGQKRAFSNVDPDKIAVWNDKFQRALRLLSSAPLGDDLVILQEEATKRGLSETPQSLAGKQKTKAEALSRKNAILSGIEKKALADIQPKASKKKLEEHIKAVRTQIENIS